MQPDNGLRSRARHGSQGDVPGAVAGGPEGVPGAREASALNGRRPWHKIRGCAPEPDAGAPHVCGRLNATAVRRRDYTGAGARRGGVGAGGGARACRRDASAGRPTSPGRLFQGQYPWRFPRGHPLRRMDPVSLCASIVYDGNCERSRFGGGVCAHPGKRRRRTPDGVLVRSWRALPAHSTVGGLARPWRTLPAHSTIAPALFGWCVHPRGHARSASSARRADTSSPWMSSYGIVCFQSGTVLAA